MTEIAHAPSAVGSRPAPGSADAVEALLSTMRGLSADRRGVTARELCGRSGWSQTQVLEGLARAQTRGRVKSLGRSPRGARLYTLATPID